jgi:hypothetical protein
MNCCPAEFKVGGKWKKETQLSVKIHEHVNQQEFETALRKFEMNFKW